MNFLQPIAISVALTNSAICLPDAALKLQNSFELFYQIAASSRPKDAREALRRLDSTQKELQAQSILPEINAGREIWLSAEDCTIGNDLTLSIGNFLARTVGATVEDLVVVDPSRVHKREAVFLTKDYAIKVFPRIDTIFNKLAAEISGMDIIRKFSFVEGCSVPFIAVGKCVINGENYLLLLMPRAPGQTIKYYLDAIFTSTNRMEALNECKAALTHLGKFLGEIHVSTAIAIQGNAPGIMDITLEKLKQQITLYLEKYQEAGGEEVEIINKFFSSVINQYNKDEFYFTLSHNDAHLENFLLDAQNHVMTLIDTPRIHYSVDANNRPLFASYVHDVARAEDDIAKWVLYHEYDEPLIDELQEAFRKGYREKAGKLINPSQLFADKAWTILTRLVSVIPHKTQEGPQGRIYKYYTHFFKKAHTAEF